MKNNSLSTVAVVGLGLLGRGIATCLLGHGFRVVGCARSAKSHASAFEYIDRGIGEMAEHLGDFVAEGLPWSERYHATQAFDDWPTCDFIIESIDEDPAAKARVFEQLERITCSDVPIASNTSSIPITQLQKSLRHPARLLGMHWFEPAHATRFLELVPGELTSEATMRAAASLAKKCGKEPSVLSRDIPGFIVNRIAYAAYREALYLLELGVADAETIDRSFRNAFGVWSTICGPFQRIDLTGGPNQYGNAMTRVLPTLSNSTTLPEPIRQLTELGATGVTGGSGFYEYTPEQAQKANDLFHSHAWGAAKVINQYFPLDES